MLTEFQRFKIQRPILTIEQACIAVKSRHGNRMHRFCILHHCFTVLPQLQFLHPSDVAVPCIFVLDLKGKGVKLIRKQLCKLRHLQPSLVRSPDPPVIDIPDATVTVEPGDRKKEIGKGIADPNLVPPVAGIGVWLHLFQRHRNLR